MIASMSKVRLEETENAYRITLTNPPLHILDIELLEEFRSKLDRVGDDKALLVISSEAGKAFSAGASVQEHTEELVAKMLRTFHECFIRMYRIGLVTVGLVDGPALGGGCELALACDLILASEKATFGLPEIKLGVFPPVASFQLTHQIPSRIGFEMLVSGEPITARRAYDCGLVNAVFPEDEFDEAADEWLRKISRHSRSSLWFAKRATRMAAHDVFEKRLAEIEHLYIEELMKTHDAKEGVEAFMERREPSWTGD